MNKKMQKTLIPGIVFLAIALILWIIMPSQVPTSETSVFTARTFPRISLGMVIICSLGLIANGFFHHVRTKKACGAGSGGINPGTLQTRDALRVLSVLGLIITGAIIGRLAGLLAAGLFLAIGMLLIYSVKKKHHYLVVTVIVVVSFFLFKNLFGLNLP